MLSTDAIIFLHEAACFVYNGRISFSLLGSVIDAGDSTLRFFLHAVNQLNNPGCRGSGLLSQLAYFFLQQQQIPARVHQPGSFNSCVQRQEICLLRQSKLLLQQSH